MYVKGGSVSGDWFRDKDGYLTTAKNRDAVLVYPINFTDLLDSGETIVSATWEPSGPTITSVLATPIVTATVTGTGTAKLTLVTTTQTRVEYFRWIGLDMRSVSDYV